MKRGAALLLFALAACGGGEKGVDPRYPPRPEGCGIKSFDGPAPFPVDELGVVEADCTGTSHCGRRLADLVCRRGGDVVWGLGESHPPNVRRGHAAHTAHTDYALREAGCAVTIYRGSPEAKTENIGAVSASCDVAEPDDACMRALKDEACKLGADVVWGVGDPLVKGTRKHVSGRAAHTK